jgi:hypothetical protein
MRIINEGTADNYFFENELSAEMFEGNDIAVFAGPMVTGTSLQNRDLLNFSTNRLGELSDWRVLITKAIQSASSKSEKVCRTMSK